MVDQIFTWLLRIVCYGIQLGGFTLIAWGLTHLVAGKHRKWKALLMAVLLAGQCLLACYAANHPRVFVPEDYAAWVDAEQREQIRDFSSGFYSANIPIFPVSVTVTYADAHRITFTVQYLFWGSVGMSLTEDGPSVEKPLTAWS